MAIIRMSVKNLRRIIREERDRMLKEDVPPSPCRRMGDGGRQKGLADEASMIELDELDVEGEECEMDELDVEGAECELDELDVEGDLEEVAPPGKGWERVVKGLKHSKGVDNPYAVAWSMKNKGYHTHRK